MSTTAQRMRAWTGPAILTYGFRPFFLGAAVWAALAAVLWVPMLTGALTLPTAFDPVSWHAHEFLYGYLAAVVASVAARDAAGLWPAAAGALHAVSGLGWFAAFAGFALLYGPLLLRRKT